MLAVIVIVSQWEPWSLIVSRQRRHHSTQVNQRPKPICQMSVKQILKNKAIRQRLYDCLISVSNNREKKDKLLTAAWSSCKFVWNRWSTSAILVAFNFTDFSENPKPASSVLPTSLRNLLTSGELKPLLNQSKEHIQCTIEQGFVHLLHNLSFWCFLRLSFLPVPLESFSHFHNFLIQTIV